MAWLVQQGRIPPWVMVKLDILVKPSHYANLYFYLFILMNVLFWNRRGAGNIQFSSIIHDYKRIYGFNILAIDEPRISGKKADKVIEQWKFDSCLGIEAQGRFEGLWLLWNKGIVDI